MSLQPTGAEAAIVSVVEQNLNGDPAAIVEPGGEFADGFPFGEEGIVYSDANHQHNGPVFNETTGEPDKDGTVIVDLPAYLVDQDYVRFAAQARDNAGYQATVTTDVPSIFYLLVDNRLNGIDASARNEDNNTDPVLGGNLQWVVEGLWQRVNTGISPGGRGDYVGLDETGNGFGPGVGINQFFAVYRFPAPTTSITIQNQGFDGGSMMSLVAAPAGGELAAIEAFDSPGSPIDFGASTLLRWAIDPAATSATISGIGDVLGMTDAVGTGTFAVSPAVDTSYTLTVVRDGATTEANTDVAVRLISSFETSDDGVPPGGKVTLSWKVRPDGAISIEPGFPDLSAETDENGVGSVDVNPEETTNYVLSVEAGGETVTAERMVEVIERGQRFALIDIGATGGRPEPGAAGGQLGGGAAGANGPVLPSTALTSDTRAEFSIALDNVGPDGAPFGRIDWRDRSDAGSESEEYSLLAEDFAKNNGGMIRVTLGGLPAGTYQVTSFHLDPGFSQCEEIRILVTDANGTAVDTGVFGDATTAGEDFEELTNEIVSFYAVSFEVTSDGASDIFVYFDGTNAFDTEVPLNGLVLVPPPVDDGQFALLDVGATGGQAEDGATGGQLGGGAAGENGPVLAPQALTSETGAEFTLAIDNQSPAGAPVGRVDWRDRGDAGPDPLTRIAEDFLKNNGGMVRVVLGGLPAGEYAITSYHIDPGFSQCEAIDILVTDAGGVARDAGVDGNASFAGAPPELAAITTELVEEHSATFTVDSDGAGDVVIYFDGTAASDTEVPLNGLNVVSTAPAAPEPILSFLPVPGTIAFGDTATLRWVVDPAATAISIEPGIGDVLGMTTDGAGSFDVTPSVDTTYTLNVTVGGEPSSATTTVFVELVSGFATSVPFLLPGEATTLSWTVRPDATVTLEPGIGDISDLTGPDGNGSVEVRPDTTTIYVLTAVVGGDEVMSFVEVRVAPEPTGTPFALLDIGALDGWPEEGATGDWVIGGGSNGENGAPLFDPFVLTSDTGAEFEVTMDAASPTGELLGGLDWRNRGFALGDPLTHLGVDFAKNNEGVIELRLAGIPAGNYNAISYHVDPDFSQCEAIQIFVTDANGTAVDTGVLADASFPGPTPGVDGLTTRDVLEHSFAFQFTSNGTDDIVIYFDGRLAADREVPLSGLRINIDDNVEPAVVTSITRDAGAGTATIEWTAQEGLEYIIQWSENLVDWQELDDLTADSENAVYVDATAGPTVLERYYRVFPKPAAP